MIFLKTIKSICKIENTLEQKTAKFTLRGIVMLRGVNMSLDAPTTRI
jgi:hypothetical protein